VVVAGARVLAEVGIEDKKGERNGRFLNRRGLRKNSNQGRKLSENIDLW